MNTFRDDILGWNKKLMNVADVNQLMSEIQRTWAYLESLFIHSEEVSGAGIATQVALIRDLQLNLWPYQGLLHHHRP
jgi:hypothetical protein